MKKLFDHVAISVFGAIARMKGYQFRLVATEKEKMDAEWLFRTQGYKLPSDFEREMYDYKPEAIRFIAYHMDKVVGTVSLADPAAINRPYLLHGLDADGEHFEIQSLIVSKDHRECSQLVLLGLFKEMYQWSLKNGIRSWISLGLRQLYITMRRYNKQIKLLPIGAENRSHPIAAWLFANHIFDSCAVMYVEDFSPFRILMKFLKKRLKNLRKHMPISIPANAEVSLTNG